MHQGDNQYEEDLEPLYGKPCPHSTRLRSSNPRHDDGRRHGRELLARRPLRHAGQKRSGAAADRNRRVPEVQNLQPHGACSGLFHAARAALQQPLRHRLHRRTHGLQSLPRAVGETARGTRSSRRASSRRKSHATTESSSPTRTKCSTRETRTCSTTSTKSSTARKKARFYNPSRPVSLRQQQALRLLDQRPRSRPQTRPVLHRHPAPHPQELHPRDLRELAELERRRDHPNRNDPSARVLRRLLDRLREGRPS